MKIEISASQLAGVRSELLLKQKRLEYSSAFLEIRLKQATMKLEVLVKSLSVYNHQHEQYEAALAGIREGSENKKELCERMAKLDTEIYNLQYRVGNLITKVVLDLPLAVAMEKAQLAVLSKYLDESTVFCFETAAS